MEDANRLTEYLSFFFLSVGTFLISFLWVSFFYVQRKASITAFVIVLITGGLLFAPLQALRQLVEQPFGPGSSIGTVELDGRFREILFSLTRQIISVFIQHPLFTRD